MNRHKKIDSRDIGLEIALIFGNYLLKTNHLHFGYWTSDLQIDLSNLPKAQENYSSFITSHIPEGTKTILDVGCGAGRLALKLIETGYQVVDCVSPSRLLTENVRNLLGNRSHIFECSYEEMETENRYDVVLFSESFQYVNLKKALENSLKFLNDGGYLLICDYFKTNAEGKSMLGGGHRLDRFYDLISQYPFTLIQDIDITRETAANLTIVNDFFTRVGLPVWNLLTYFTHNNYPFLSRVLQWKFRKKIEKIQQKYFTGTINAENFGIFKTYRLLLYKKTNPDIVSKV